jgi:hypothetical protein
VDLLLPLLLLLLRVIWLQPDGVRLPTAHIDQRAKFDASKWAAEHKLSHPVGAVHFITRAAH